MMPRMGGRPVLVVFSGLVHPSPAARRAFASIVRTSFALPEFHATLHAFGRLDPARHAAAAVFFHRGSIDPHDFSALEAFVAAGGGLFALHGAFASFKDEPRWTAFLGAVFAGHAPPGPLAVHPASDPGPFAGIPAFTVRDELYRTKPVVPIDAHLVATRGTEEQPVVWTRTHGRGRVCCCTLGHTAATLRHDAVRLVVSRALAWVSRDAGDSHGS
jgi:hypothetical protein